MEYITPHKEESTLLQLGTFKRHLLQQKFYYLGIFLLFFTGFLIGSFYSNTVSQTDFELSKQTAENFISSAKTNALDYRLIFWEDFSPCLIISLSGLILFGFAGTVFFLFKAGFSAGFFLSFLMKAFSMKGFFLGSLFLWCQLLFLLPAITAISLCSFRINLFFLHCTLHRAPAKQSLKSELFLHITALLICGILVACSALIKCWLLPPLCRYLFA